MSRERPHPFRLGDPIPDAYVPPNFGITNASLFRAYSQLEL